MAQGAVAPISSNGTTGLTAEELHEILECEKIVRFRDAILAGTHPRIKVPPHLNGKNATRNGSSAASLTPRPNLPASQTEPKAITPSTHVEDIHSLSNNRSSLTPRRAAGRSGGAMQMSAKAEINPILLEKSDDLIKAEIQLQRVRLERVLREQFEQRRLSVKASAQTSESLPDFDISDVLSKALTIVHPSTANEAEHILPDHASASDSFDENTFYSSQHETPEQSASSQEVRERGDAFPLGTTLPSSHPVTSTQDKDSNEPRDDVTMDAKLSKFGASAEQDFMQQQSPTVLQHPQLGASYLTDSSGLKKSTTDTAAQSQSDATNDEEIAGDVSRNAEQMQEATVSNHFNMQSGLDQETPEPLTDLDPVQTGASLKRKFAETDSSTSADFLEPAIIRNLEDVPTLAPQPARVSPLAVARAPPIINQSIITDEASPAQVAALRKPSAASSRDSSPKENKASDKKKAKKKKRKSSGKQVETIDAPDSPYIKPEPRSASPFAVAPLPRPLQRQRRTVQQGSELNYDEPRYEVPRDEPREQTSSSRYVEHGIRLAHDPVADDERIYEPREAEIYGYRRVGRDGKQYSRVVSQDVYRAPPSPMMSAASHSAHVPHPVRAASHAITDRQIQEAPRYLRDLPPRAAVRPYADRERSRSPIMRDRPSPVLMAPPRLPPGRIVVDDYGRQYYAPAPVPVSSRRSVAPPSRPADEDVIYERTSVRPVARPVSDLYEEDGVVYRRSSPPMTTSRRVISQVDPDMDYRSYRQRDYSSRPVVLAPSTDEYVRVREPVDMRHSEYAFEAPATYAPLGYAPRAQSVRPEVIRVEASREYATRVQSVRPDLPPKDHASSARTENVRGEGATREYVPRFQSVRPEIIGQEYNKTALHREPVREGPPREYGTRVQSVRPDQAPKEYASGTRHDPRQDAIGQSHREFSVRPGDPEITRREYVPQPDSVYAPSTRLVSRRVISEGDYVERSRDDARDVYMDDGRRDVIYR